MIWPLTEPPLIASFLQPEPRVLRRYVVEALAHFEKDLTQLHGDAHKQGARAVGDGVSVGAREHRRDERGVEFDGGNRVVDDHFAREDGASPVPFLEARPCFLWDHDEVSVKL